MKGNLHPHKSFAFFIVALFALTCYRAIAQTDTLHIYYKGLQTEIVDSNEVKIAEWAKKLNGRHVDVEVLAYYNSGEFRKNSQTRADEIFIVLNRKARNLITIKSIGPEKGKKSQRSMADIVYTFSGGTPEPKEKTEKQTAKKEEKEKEKPKDKADKEQKPAKANGNPNVLYDTTYVNGVMKLTKRKVVVLDPNYTYDTIYVNGKMKVTKTKIKGKK